MSTTRYIPENGAFVGIDLPGICNRALFCCNTPTTLLAGDRPVLRLIRYGTLLGTLQLWSNTENGVLPLENAASIRFSYKANLAEWQIADPLLPCGITLTLAFRRKRKALFYAQRPTVLSSYSGATAASTPLRNATGI